MPFGGSSDLFIENEETSMLGMDVPSFSLDSCFPSLDLEQDSVDLLNGQLECEDVGLTSSSNVSVSDDSIKIEDDMELVVEEEYVYQHPELSVQIPNTFAIKRDSPSVVALAADVDLKQLEEVVNSKDMPGAPVLIRDGDNYFLLDSPPLTNNSSAGSTPPSSPGDSSTENVRSFVPIVPKPPSPVVAVSTAEKPVVKAEPLSGEDANQTIILTQDQINSLQLQGSLQIEVKKEPVAAPIMAPATPTPVLDPCTRNSMEEKALKRQLRMIKNRESASKSRIKKREYVAQLEAENEELKRENTVLKQKNMELTKRLLEVQSDEDSPLLSIKNHSFSRSWSPIFDKVGKSNQTVMLMACLFLMLNLAPLSTLLIGNTRSTEVEKLVNVPRQFQSPVAVRGGRALLWMEEESAEPTKRGNSSSGCPFRSINQSESQRLENELRGWMVRMANASVPESSPKQDYSLNGYLPNSFKKERPGNRSKHRQNTHSKKRARASKIAELNIYGKNKEQKRAGGVLGDIHRREDTFYVVAFSGEQLLLPATNHNDSSRPKMSLVLPTNYSLQLPDGKIAMVQIDCEVLNTKLVHIKESALPVHHRPREQFKEAKNMSSPLQPPEVMAGKWPNQKKPMPNLIDVLKKRK